MYLIAFPFLDFITTLPVVITTETLRLEKASAFLLLSHYDKRLSRQLSDKIIIKI